MLQYLILGVTRPGCHSRGRRSKAAGDLSGKEHPGAAIAYGTSLLAALSEGIYEFRIVITDNNATIGVSAPATVTVTGTDGAMPTPPPAPPALGGDGDHGTFR